MVATAAIVIVAAVLFALPCLAFGWIARKVYEFLAKNRS